MTKSITLFVAMIGISTLLTSCKLISYPSATAPCGDPVEYYNEQSTKTDTTSLETSAGAVTDPKTNIDTTPDLPSKYRNDACSRLHEAIRLSMPDSKQQNDKKALVLLSSLKQSGELSESDQRFNDMLLQHVSQRQKLRNMIGSQDERLKKTETQLDQLKDIEVEIDKKERSVPSPVSE